MSLERLHGHKQAQSIARETIEFLKSFIKEVLSAKEIKDAAEKFMQEKTVVKSSWLIFPFFYGIA